MNLFLGDVINQLGMWGGFSSFSSSEQRWQKALRAPCADAALELELLLWKTALGERSHL